VDLRYTPELHFIADKSYDDATAIDRLLMDPKVRRDVRRPIGVSASGRILDPM
jgi:hypothetical protein